MRGAASKANKIKPLSSEDPIHADKSYKLHESDIDVDCKVFIDE